jgi:hypothetical protein
MYDYFLGGSHNFAVDRAAAETALTGFPELAQGMRANRDFLRRAVQFLVAAGIDQFIDLGSGIPTAGNVHEIAQRANPEARVVYVDIEPIAVQHSLALLAHNPLATAIQADLRQPAQVLGSSAVRELVRLDRPVAVLIVGTMHFIPDVDEPKAIVAGYRDAMVAGSYLVLTHGTSDGQDPDKTEAAEAVYRRSPTPLKLRDSETVLAMLDGFDLVEPGLAAVHGWRPESVSSFPSPFAWVGVGRKP